MKSRKSYLLLSLILSILYFGQASAQQVRFSHFSVKDGVSQSEIKCIFQDSEGFLWFGTQNGLNKFDGYNFEKYFHDPADSTSLSNNWIFCIAEDSIGVLWIGTKGGLNKFEKKTGHFTRINYQLPGSVIRDLFVYGLAAHNSFIYINTPPALTVLNINNGEFNTYKNSFGYDGILHDIGYPILRSENGLIWIGSVNGLSCFDPVKKKFQNFLQNETGLEINLQGEITALYEDRAGNILAGTANGLYACDTKNNRFTHWAYDSEKAGSLNNNLIRSITQDHTGAIWTGTEGGGLNKLMVDRQGNTVDFINFRSYADNQNYISHDIVYSLYEDKSFNLWIGTLAGIDKMNLKRKKFRHYEKTDDPGSVNLLDNVIASIYKADDGKLWIGTWNKGLNIYDRNTNEVIHYSSSMGGNRHIPGDNVHVIFRDSRDRIWLGTRNGVCLYQHETGRFVPFQEYFQIRIPDYFKGNRVYCIIEDSKGNMWMGTGNGIFILNTQTKSTRIIQTGDSGPLHISNNLVYSLLEDRDEQIWIATSNGLNKFVPEEGRIYQYFRDPYSKNTLRDNFIISLCEDNNGNIWIGTSTGLNRFNKADSIFTQYTMDNGLPSNIIYDIMEDSNHDLWFTTGNGLARYNSATGIIRPYTSEEGVQGMEFNIKATYKGSDGELFFGGMDGFISFYPDSLQDNEYIPPIKITSFEKENNGIRSKVGVYDDEIRLSYRDYSFTIEFSALDYSDPSKNQYAYQLEPLSDKWIDLGNRRFVHFTNLPAGRYFFRVKGTNNDGYWNEEGTGIAIIITPPWWKSRYALIAYVLMVVVTIIFFVKWREKRLVAERNLLEQKVRERTLEIDRQKEKLKELNATKDKFFSILAHDLKGPFSSLYSMSELMSNNYDALDDPDKRTGLDKIYKLGEMISRLIDNLLTWSRSQRGGLEFSPVKFNLSKLVEVNVNLHKVNADEKGVFLWNNVAEDLFAFGDLEMMNTVVRNLISNAIKFTAKEGSVEVNLIEQHDFYEVLVKDQGVGIPPENMEKLFRIDVKYKTTGTAGETGTGLGLVLCREFVEKNGGRIWCESQQNSGTTFHFTIPRNHSVTS
jgi:signal transduction histidine kinase/ligand-binding sensor domain-containing protein